MKLKELGEYFIGLTYKPEAVADNGTIVLRSGNIQDGKFDLSDIIRVNTKIRDKQYVKPGDILMCSRNGSARLVGKSTIIPELSEPMTFGAFMTVFRTPYNSYLQYFFQSNSFRKQLSSSKTTTINQITISMLDNIDIDLPEKTILEERCNKLGIIASIIDARKKELGRLDELIKARFVELFGDPSLNTKGYPVKSLPEIAEYWNGLTYKPENVSDAGTIVLRSSNIQNAQLDFDDTVRVNCPIGDKKYVQDNDILMCSRNGSARLVGKVALIKNITEPMSFGAFMMIIRSRFYPYLMTFFQLPAFRTQITTGATTTINQITGRMLDNVKLPVPDETELDSFVSFIEQVDKSKVAVQKALNEAQLLFDSLMQEYFG